MKKCIVMLACLGVLTGCHQQALPPPDKEWVSAYPRTELVPFIEVKNKAMNYQLLSGNDPSLEKAFRQYQETGQAPTIITEGFIKFAYDSAQQPIVETTPFQETVLSLEVGEKFTHITTGDPSRWSYAVATSGEGKTFQQHVLIKPSQRELSTNMVIATNRRMYNIRLVATDGDLVKGVSFWYPQAMVEKANHALQQEAHSATIATLPTLKVNQLNFNYQIAKSNFNKMPSWKPERVFDDGTHTYIQFPSTVRNGDLPVLFLVDNPKEKTLVNYRFKSPYFVVDRVFKHGLLVAGAGKTQQSITLTNVNYGEG